MCLFSGSLESSAPLTFDAFVASIHSPGGDKPPDRRPKGRDSEPTACLSLTQASHHHARTAILVG